MAAFNGGAGAAEVVGLQLAVAGHTQQAALTPSRCPCGVKHRACMSAISPAYWYGVLVWRAGMAAACLQQVMRPRPMHRPRMGPCSLPASAHMHCTLVLRSPTQLALAPMTCSHDAPLLRLGSIVGARSHRPSYALHQCAQTRGAGLLNKAHVAARVWHGQPSHIPGLP